MSYRAGGCIRFVCIVSSALVVLVSSTGCRKDKPIDFNKGLPDGQLALRKISPEQYPDFGGTWNLNVMGRSVDQSLAYMAHPSSKRFYPYLDITHDRAVASLRAFRELVDNAMRQGATAGTFINQEIRAKFEVYKSWGAPRPEGGGYTDIVLFTGYCTPDREASLVRTGAYQWPIYKRPADLVADSVSGETIGRKMGDGKVGAYWTRAEIEGQGKLAGLELAWLKSRWEAYVVTVQGSGRLKLPGGRLMEVGYAGHNGYDYSSVAMKMVDDGLIKREDVNLKTLTAYFAAHPEAEPKYLWQNQRTVFFAERRGGPFGCLNVPVTTFGTIATDKAVYPRAMPAFLIVSVPRTDNAAEKWPFRGFMMDQDAGGAIRASGRCDIYMGIGDAGEALAGHQMSEGELYYVAVKPELVRKYMAAPAAGKAEPEKR